jgi:cytochrome c biogenesis protein CcmG/thiol:disulfide interchange protein DsbE
MKNIFASALFVPIALLAAFLLVGLYALNNKQNYEPPAPNQAPALELLTFPQGSGKQFNLEEMRGEKVLVNFFASWCLPCAEESPVLRGIALAHALPILGVAYNDKEAPLSAFLDRHGKVFSRVVLDPGGQTAIDWGVTGVPETFLVDEKGSVLARHSGPLTPEIWANKFAGFLPPPVLTKPKR